eukprot:TRINITY_DN37772_c0_g1_i1.p1 TRINITY_DN37772_c0_g1~~TRINITY_DN37772_c0_g1_i1.p1  ORF type:complete len:215 (-),score=47.39 TRINITY_DN37772_c0_g1_i1:40-660(-)
MGVQSRQLDKKHKLPASMKYQILVAVFAPILASFYGQIPPVAGTFRCDDLSIKFPYQGDTVSAKLLFQAILLPIILVVFITEASLHHENGVMAASTKASQNSAYVYFRYWVGQSVNMIANIALKTMASTPRPHFIDTCHPDWTQVDCDSNDGNVMFDLSICQTDSSLLLVNDSMKSFPSGHSQLALFAAVFVIVYLNTRAHSSLPK